MSSDFTQDQTDDDSLHVDHDVERVVGRDVEEPHVELATAGEIFDDGPAPEDEVSLDDATDENPEDHQDVDPAAEPAPETGDLVIDAALRDLAEAPIGDLDAQIERGEQVQRTLQGRLSDLGG
ncbi:hypothetical protein [Knoellia subterranea]|uniref:Uncharacterized protein n=1 Tax=Knoellia subterranea KCTC 19937 TaxID=1385521 RepID=A0A0A0JG65_9MICO|nr:hypothetical protein [Knoellia subterranea]KGN36118.1 hypothetical protein N803_09470 [Knoellia subterranea KCTC 19937]